MDKVFEADYPTETIKEGKAQVVVPKLSAFVQESSEYAPSKAPVFYNPVMEFNRDVTILAFQTYQRTTRRNITICEPLTGTGIRGVRFATEIHGVKKVVSGDINERSAKLATYNVSLNELQKRVTVKHKDANRLLSEHSAPHKRFDIIDIDPFGTPVPYIDSAIRALRNHGLLAATATDMAPLCGVHPKACIRKYGGKPLRTEYCQELAVRLLAGCVATAAAKQDIGTRVLFSHCSDHYIRVYTEIAYGAQKADESIRNLGYVLHCFKCLHRESTKSLFAEKTKCPECGTTMDYAGRLFLGKIFDRQFCESILNENSHRALKNSAKITKLLSLSKGEAEAPSTYYVLDRVSQKLGLPAPSVATFFQTLHDSGFQAVPTHFNSRGVRTDAPAMVVQKTLQKLVATA
ncbi:MAG TPA: tRNA (guanine(10)-N(2))-dimethyltransferase [Candidatus Bathyarchaeia archaeon]|nr:tRNA (guanine(10)-N(2))-dimethyltransferase [Candidatus Bathyarchaeia archaeon]